MRALHSKATGITIVLLTLPVVFPARAGSREVPPDDADLLNDHDFHEAFSLEANISSERLGTMGIPENFVGFSLETTSARAMLFRDGDKDKVGRTPRATYLRLLRNLVDAREGPLPAESARRRDVEGSPMVLRLGGNSADQGCFEYHATDTDSLVNGGLCEKNITGDDLWMYEKFATTAESLYDFRVTFVLGTNLAVRNPHWGVQEIAAVVKRGLFRRGIVSSVEIGNECDSYFLTHSAAHLSFYREYEEAFKTYLRAYLRDGGLPPKAIQGATFADVLRPEWDLALPEYVKTFQKDLASLSLHNYPTTKCISPGREEPEIDMSKIVSRTASKGQAELYSRVVASTAESGIPFVLGEVNSVSCGGQDGVSNAMGAALWALDYLSEMSKIGVSLVNFHGGPQGSYAPILIAGKAIRVRPLYYALLVFTEFTAGGASWLSATVSGEGANSAMHAVIASNGDIRVLIISKEDDSKRGVVFDALLDISNSAPNLKYEERVRIFWLMSAGQGLDAQDGITYAGQTFDGSYTGEPLGKRRWTSATLKTDGHLLHLPKVTLPPSSAALLVIRATKEGAVAVS